MWMNLFPVKSGISEKWSPQELVSRTKLDTKLGAALENLKQKYFIKIIVL